MPNAAPPELAAVLHQAIASAPFYVNEEGRHRVPLQDPVHIAAALSYPAAAAP
jgi:MoxR-like ATPase